MKKFFVFIYPSDGRVQKLLDLSVFVLNPNEKWPAHVTLAGPFDRRPNSRSNSNFDATIFSLGVWNFFKDGLNTVYLKVGFTDWRKYWTKPDFVGDPVPHLSLYNGKDRDLAAQLFYRIQPTQPYFGFKINGITVVSSESAQAETLLRSRVDPRCLPATSNYTIDELARLTKEERIAIAAAALSACSDSEPSLPGLGKSNLT